MRLIGRLHCIFSNALSEFIPPLAETVLAVRNVGLQLTTVFDDGSKAVKFVDSGSIRAIVMNEGIQGCGVHYYIAIIVAGQRDMVLAFPHVQPRLAIAAPIFREMHSVMLASCGLAQ